MSDPIILAAFDPGMTGAVCIMNEHGAVEVHDIPVMGTGADKMVNGAHLSRLLIETHVNAAIVEKQWNRPTDGATQAFKAGRGYGQLLGSLQALSIPYSTVSPQAWKKAMGLQKDKEQSRRRAIELFPDLPSFNRKKDHGRAEAALLARWWFTHFEGRAAA